MRAFYEICQKKFSSDCSKEACLRAQVNYMDQVDCVLKSFSNNPYLEPENPNSILAAERQKYKALGLTSFPEIYINKNKYKGSLAYSDILLSLCSALHDEEDECRNINLESENDLDVTSVLAVSLLVFVLGVIVLIGICKKLAKKRYMNDLNTAVNKYVSEFSASKEESANI